MKSISFIRSNHALAGVIEALLLIALVAIILSIIQIRYVPIIMDQKESEHMDTIENQFAQLKSVIEIQSIMGVAGDDSPIVYSPMSSPITLGGNELPYLISQGSQGTINIIDKDNGNCGNINVVSTTDDPAVNLTIPLTSIKYDATNYYFVDQNYILEGGAIILEQPGEGNTMKVDAPMNVKKISNNLIKIFYTIPVFDTPEGKEIISGKDNCFVRTNYVSTASFEIHLSDLTDDYLSIHTDYAKAWYESLVRDDSGILWEYNDTLKITVSLEDTDNPTYITIKPNFAAIDVKLTIVYIDIQVGAGYVIPNND